MHVCLDVNRCELLVASSRLVVVMPVVVVVVVVVVGLHLNIFLMLSVVATKQRQKLQHVESTFLF